MFTTSVTPPRVVHYENYTWVHRIPPGLARNRVMYYYAYIVRKTEKVCSDVIYCTTVQRSAYRFSGKKKKDRFNVIRRNVNKNNRVPTRQA